MSFEVLLVVGLVGLVVLVVLVAWLWDRWQHRKFLIGHAKLGGPEATRAAGEAWRSIGGLPTMHLRAPGAHVGLGALDKSDGADSTSRAMRGDPPRSPRR